MSRTSIRSKLETHDAQVLDFDNYGELPMTTETLRRLQTASAGMKE